MKKLVSFAMSQMTFTTLILSYQKNLGLRCKNLFLNLIHSEDKELKQPWPRNFHQIFFPEQNKAKTKSNQNKNPLHQQLDKQIWVQVRLQDSRLAKWEQLNSLSLRYLQGIIQQKHKENKITIIYLQPIQQRIKKK